MLICTNKSSMKSYRGMRTIQLKYIQFNFHFSPTCLKTLYCDGNNLSRCRVKVKVLLWCWGNVNEPQICLMELEETIQMLQNYCTEDFSKQNMNNNLVFFRDEIEIFIISLFETRSRFVSSISRASRRDREFALLNLEFRDWNEK